MPGAPLSATANITPVSGARIVPPIIPAMPSSAQISGVPGSQCPTIQPVQPPMINSGASTPPEVPELSDTSQITVLTASRSSTALITTCPDSNPPITS